MQPINPVTLRGATHKELPVIARNLTVSRLWISEDGGKAWRKPMTLLVWDGKDEEPRQLAGVIVPEHEFVLAVTALYAGQKVILTGKPSGGSDEKIDVEFISVDKPFEGWVRVIIWNGQKSSCRVKSDLYLRWNTLFGGLAHLFPKGEITPPEAN
jgi:hypothetical protein